MKYHVQIADLATQYIKIKVEIETKKELTELIFPAWRPGRYELGNFAKNVKGLRIYDSNINPLEFSKVEKNKWTVDTAKTNFIYIEYQYHASELNAGSTFVSDEQLYVNPVNCFMYTKDTMLEKCSVELGIPADWKICCSMPQENHVLRALDYHELVDSPFIASPSMQHDFYVVNDIKFHLWFQGEFKPDWDRLKTDFTKFTEKQLEHFKAFPTDEYHFIFQITPYTTYHGVEHKASTVIALGPTYDVMEELYTELLGVSSHELYHAWNIKSIRPKEMYPYDFSQENYSRLGFVCEGVTTYLGDQFLLKSGVFDLDQYLIELTKSMKRHFDNSGRFSMSVADSSFDTWLDGYVAGAPNRKTSIYVEGSMIALICDVKIMKATNNLASLNDVMRNLYEKFALKGIGYTEEDYKNELELVAGESFDQIFNDLVYGTADYEPYLIETMAYLGITLEGKPSQIKTHAQLGVKCLEENNQTIVKVIYPESVFDTSNIMLEDYIVAVNGMSVKGDFEKWFRYFQKEKTLKLTIDRKGRLLEIEIPLGNQVYFKNYQLTKMKNETALQKESYNFWIK